MLKRRVWRVALYLLVLIVVLVIWAAVVEFRVMPRLTEDWQPPLIWTLGAILLAISTLATLARLTGYGLGEFLMPRSDPVSSPPSQKADRM